MNTNTPTPRTDELDRELHCPRLIGDRYGALLDFARTLERETAELTARAEAAELNQVNLQEQLNSYVKRAEAAESLVIKGKSAVNAAILYMAMDSDSEDFDEAQFHRLRDEAQEFLALTPASMVSKLAELEKELAEWQAGNRSVIPSGIQRRDARIAEQDAELARLREEYASAKRVYMEADDRAVAAANEASAIEDALRERVSELEKTWNAAQSLHVRNEAELRRQAEQRAERLADALRFYAGKLREDGNGYQFEKEPTGFLGDVARAALADQPAQANTQLAALIAAGDLASKALVEAQDMIEMCLAIGSHLEAHPGSPAQNIADAIKALALAKQGAQPVESGVHSCGDHCQRPKCVERRELAALREDRARLEHVINELTVDQLRHMSDWSQQAREYIDGLRARKTEGAS